MHQQLPGWRSLIKSIVGRVYANWVKSKRVFPRFVTPLHAFSIWDQYFTPDIPSCGVCTTFPSPLTFLHCVLDVWIQVTLLLGQHVASDKSFARQEKGEVSFPVVWIWCWQICLKKKMDNIRCGQRQPWSRLTQTLIKPLEIWRNCES